MIVSLDEFKAYLATTDVDPVADEVRQESLTSGEEQVANLCGAPWRDFTVSDGSTEDRVYVPDGSCILRIHDCVEVTAVTVDGVAVTGWQAEPLNRGDRPIEQLFLSTGWTVSTSGMATVTVTMKPGWTSIPTVVTQAVKLAAKDDLMSRKVDFGVLGGGDVGVVRELANPRVVRLVARYRRVETYGIA